MTIATKAIAATFLLFAPIPAHADDSALERLRSEDRRVGAVAMRLATANIALCDGVEPWSGLVLHDRTLYEAGVRDEVARHFALGDTSSIMAIVPGSPADEAGFREDDQLIAINGHPLPATIAPSSASRDAGVMTAGRIADALARGAVPIDVRRAGRMLRLSLGSVPGCRSHVELVPASGIIARSDGTTVTISSALVEFVQGDDELAIVIGHETAHNILHHPQYLAAAGGSTGLGRFLPRNSARIRLTEIEADRLGLYLMARAGYDPRAGIAFWKRFGSAHGAGVFGDGSHPSEAKRSKAAEEVATEIEIKRADGIPLLPDAHRRAR